MDQNSKLRTILFSLGFVTLLVFLFIFLLFKGIISTSFFSPSGSLAGVTLTDFGFNGTGTIGGTMSAELEQGESICVYLQGHASSPVSEVRIHATYGSIAGNRITVGKAPLFGASVAHAQLTIPGSENCGNNVVLHDFGPVYENEFARPFQYTAPTSLPDQATDTISITITTERGGLLKRELTVNLISTEDALKAKVVKACTLYATTPSYKEDGGDDLKTYLQEKLLVFYQKLELLDASATVSDIDSVDREIEVYVKSNSLISLFSSEDQALYAVTDDYLQKGTISVPESYPFNTYLGYIDAYCGQ